LIARIMDIILYGKIDNHPLNLKFILRESLKK
jgi:hypothetical protein